MVCDDEEVIEADLIRNSTKAFLVRIGNRADGTEEHVWIPHSQVLRVGGGKVIVRKWFAQEKGWI